MVFKDIELVELKSHAGTGKTNPAGGRPVWNSAVLTGSWSVEGKELVQATNGPPSRFLIGNPACPDFNLKASCKAERESGTVYFYFHYLNDRNCIFVNTGYPVVSYGC